MNISILPSARARDAQANLEAMIAKGKASSAFGPVDWEAPVWEDLVVKRGPVTDGKPGNGRFYFITGEGGRRGGQAGEPMQKPFVDFLKAGLRIHEDEKPKAETLHHLFISASRALHDALKDVDYDPCRALPRHFTTAVQNLAGSRTQASAYRAGAALVRVAKWIDKYGVGRVHLGWKNPINEPQTNDRNTVDAAAARESKMPSQAALDALPIIANQVSDPSDVLRMRTVELLCCGGFRLNEVLGIPADCETTEAVTRDGRPVLDAGGQPVTRYGIRYYALKGFGHTVKWIPTPMVDVAKRAVSDILRLTKEARADALWIHQNPGQHPIFANIDPDRLLTSNEAAELLKFTSIVSARRWLKSAGVPFLSGHLGDQKHAIRIRAGDAEQALLDAVVTLPAKAKLRLHERLFLIRTNSMHRAKGEIAGTIEMLTAPKIRDFITGGPDKPAVFAHFGFTEPDGSPIRVRSHQFRHWLNTLAQEGGLSQELIARWSGRKDVKQNAAYDHISGNKLAKKVQAMAEAGEMVGQMTRVRDSLPLADRKEFMKTQVATAHVTEIGLCVHDWSLVPCEVHGECATCIEHVVEKGNAAQIAEVKRQIIEVEGMLEIAEMEDAEGTYGASRWVASHRRRLDGLRAVLAIHDHDSIPDGTLVHLGTDGKVTVES